MCVGGTEPAQASSAVAGSGGAPVCQSADPTQAKSSQGEVMTLCAQTDHVLPEPALTMPLPERSEGDYRKFQAFLNQCRLPALPSLTPHRLD